MNLYHVSVYDPHGGKAKVGETLYWTLVASTLDQALKFAMSHSPVGSEAVSVKLAQSGVVVV